MAVQELELESLISKDKLTESLERIELPSGLGNKYLCYIVDIDECYYRNKYKIVIATIEDEKSVEYATKLLEIPLKTSAVTITPRELIRKLESETELLKNIDFRRELIQVVFQQDQFDAVELLLNQNVFSWEGFLRISVRFPRVLRYALEVKLFDFDFIIDGFADGSTLLHDCVEWDKAESMRLIFNTLQARTDISKDVLQRCIDKQNKNNLSALHYSATKPSHGCLVELLKAGADVGIVDINGNSVFHFAGYFDNPRAISTIFSHIESTTGSISLHKAMRHLNRLHFPPIILSKSEEVTNLFLKYIDPTEIVDKNGNFMIHLATKFRNLSVVKSLISLGVDLNRTNREMLTPLKISAREGYLKIVRVLLEAGASVEGEGGGDTALFLAGFNGHVEVVKLLIEYGACLHIRDRTLLHVAALGANTGLIEYLIQEQTLDISATDSEGESPLFKAVRAGCKLCVNILLVNGAYPNQVNCRSENLLNIAIEKDLLDIVELLVQYKVDRNYLKSNGMSPLMLACLNDNVEIMTLLADDITAESFRWKDNDGNNLFHIIALNDSIQCANFLFSLINDKIKNSTLLKDILYKDRNNEGLLLFDIFFQRKSKYLKDFLINVPVEYFFDYPKYLHDLYDEGYYDLLVLILDRSVIKGQDVRVCLKYFDATSDGLYPGNAGFRYFRKSFFHKMLNCPYEELKYHPVVGLIAETKLAPYKFIAYAQLVFHSILFTIVSFALISGSYTCEDQLFVYNDPISIGRLVCEIISILFFIHYVIVQFLHFGTEWRQIYENDQEFSHGRVEISWMKASTKYSLFRRPELGFRSNFQTNIFWLDSKTKFILSAFYEYFSQLYNILSIFVMGLVITFVVLRIIGDQTQWAFASLAFLGLSLIFLQYVRIIPSLGAYIASILKIFQKDIPKFSIVSLVILAGYIVSIHLAGRYEAQLRQADNSVCPNSSFIFWFNSMSSINYNLRFPLTSGMILLVDGGPSEEEENLLTLNFVFNFVYLFYAYLIIVVLLNILIAQLSQTYADISSEREFHFSIYLSVFFELNSLINLLFGRYYRSRGVIEHVTLPISEWKMYLDKRPSRNSDLLVRDIDYRSKAIEKTVDMLHSTMEKFKLNLSNVTELAAHLYGGGKETKSCKFRESKERKSSVQGDISLESVNMRLDSLEGKMEKIIHLLEAK